MVTLKQFVLPDYRAHSYTYRTDYRAGEGVSRPDYRSYARQKLSFLGPIIGHLLDMPSVVLLSRCLSKWIQVVSKGGKESAPPYLVCAKLHRLDLVNS